MRPKNVVSTKLALYSRNFSTVLVMHYPVRNIYGLPGGHVEPQENPDDAIRRELMEELTLTVDTLRRADFFLREGDRGPIILAYTSIASEAIAVHPTRPEFEYGKWVTKDEVDHLQMSAEYKRFVLQNWPNAQS
jgi:8-oxo-dGTP pyrophosphatase MutT (NUDIX family)